MMDVLKELDGVFKLISTIPVSGEDVDAMAAARAKLRRVYAELSKFSETTAEAQEEQNEK